MKRLREHVKRHLVRKARAGSAPRLAPIIGAGRRRYKPYRKEDESEEQQNQRLAAAWAKIGDIS